MGRSRQRAKLRDVVIGARFTDDEAAALDRARGSLSRAEYIRFLVARARREGFALEGEPVIRRGTNV